MYKELGSFREGTCPTGLPPTPLDGGRDRQMGRSSCWTHKKGTTETKTQSPEEVASKSRPPPG